MSSSSSEEEAEDDGIPREPSDSMLSGGVISAAAAVARQLTTIKATNTSTIWSRLRLLRAAAPPDPRDPAALLLTSQCLLGHILVAAAGVLLLQGTGMTVFGH